MVCCQGDVVSQDGVLSRRCRMVCCQGDVVAQDAVLSRCGLSGWCVVKMLSHRRMVCCHDDMVSGGGCVVVRMWSS